MGIEQQFPEGLEFYPGHPSDEKTQRIKSIPSPLLEQSKPFDVKELCTAFEDDLEAALKRYDNKRFEVSGVVINIELDIHNLPTVQLSDKVGGRCYAHCIFLQDDVMRQVSIGDKVTIRSNFLVMSNWYGVVMKCSELV